MSQQPYFQHAFSSLGGMTPPPTDYAALAALSPLAGLAPPNVAPHGSNFAPPNPAGHELPSVLDQIMKLQKLLGGGNPFAALFGGGGGGAGDTGLPDAYGGGDTSGYAEDGTGRDFDFPIGPTGQRVG